MDELEKIYQDIINKRITAIRPDYSASILLKVMIRKKKIQRMFQNPS